MPSVLPWSSTPSQRGAVPLPVVEVAVGLRDVARHREQQRHRVLGVRERDRVGRVHHHHAAPGGRLDVDVVDADPGATDDDELVAGGEHVGGDLGRAADHERRGAAHGVEQLVGREPEPHVDLEPGRAHRLEPAVGEPLGDEDALHQSRVDAVATRRPARSTGRTRAPSSLAMRSTPSTRSSSPSANESRA